MAEENIFPLEAKRGTALSYTAIFYEDDGVTPVNLTGYTAVGAVYDKPGGTKLADLVCTITAPGTAGEVTIYLAHATVTTLPITEQTCGNTFSHWYYVNLVSGGGVPSRFTEGPFYVSY